MFSHMGLGHVSLNTFFKCQRVSEDILIILKDIWHDTFQQSEVLFNHLCYFEYVHMGRCSFFLNYTFAEQTFPCYLPLLATLSDFDVKKTKRPKGWNHHSRRWPT